MTTAIATSNQQALTPSLPELALRLIVDRVPIRIADDPYRGRHVVRMTYPRLTGPERGALEKSCSILQEALTPGHRAPVIAMLARLANHRAKEKTPQEWKMLFEDYAEDLAEFSNSHVQEAIRDHRQSNAFFPASSELRARCKTLQERDRQRLNSAEALLVIDDRAREAAQ